MNNGNLKCITNICKLKFSVVNLVKNNDGSISGLRKRGHTENTIQDVIIREL